MQVRLISYCPKHCSAHPELSGVQVVKEGEKEDRWDLFCTCFCAPALQITQGP